MRHPRRSARFARPWSRSIPWLVVTLCLLGVAALPAGRRLDAPLRQRAQRPARATATVTVQWTHTLQRIDGFGAAFPHQAIDLMTFPEPIRSRVVDLLFSPSTGAGLTMLRNEIGCGNDPTLGTIEPSPGQFDFSGDRGQVWLMHQATRRAAVTFISTVWSPPGWMKTNGQCARGGYLAPSHYGDFARYLAQYVRGYWQHHHLRIAAVSLSNEPNAIYSYQSSQWTGQALHDFIAGSLRPAFARLHVTAPLYVPESFWNTQPALLAPTLRDPATRAAIGVIARHGYHGGTGPWFLARAYHKPTWQTEISYFTPNDPSIADGLRWAENIHAYLTHGGASAWLWWWGINGAGAHGDGEGLVYLTRERPSYLVSKRLYTMGNYSRFVRPGYVRVAATAQPAAGLYVSAYRDPTARRLVLVAINATAHERRLLVRAPGVPISSLTPYVTSATENLTQAAAVAVRQGSAVVTLPARSVSTYAGSWAPPLHEASTYEAEDMAGGGLWVVACRACSGGFRVAGLSPSAPLQFSDVAVPTSGAYALTIVSWGRGRAADISVDGAPPRLLRFPTGGSGVAQTLITRVRLHRGGNTLLFTAHGALPTPEIDRITLARVSS